MLKTSLRRLQASLLRQPVVLRAGAVEASTGMGETEGAGAVFKQELSGDYR